MSSCYAIKVFSTGGPETLRWTRTAIKPLAPGEVRLRHTAIGLNFIDVYHRTGLYAVQDLPFIPGMEAAGIVEAAAEDVHELAPGDRVAYASPPLGAYSEVRNFPAHRCIKLPANISDAQAAAGLLKGMTAEYLLYRAYSIESGSTALVHAAAGGVGLFLCQWASALGATVIGTCSTEQKAQLALDNGCRHIILYDREDFAERVLKLTAGAGVDVVYDSVGRDTLMRSLSCLRTRGMLVSFGQSSGAPAPIDIGLLGTRSLFLTRPSLMTYTESREDLEASADRWFNAVRDKTLKPLSPLVYALKDAAIAHRNLEQRRSIGPSIFIP
jgi:NADPH:quinone reductase